MGTNKIAIERLPTEDKRKAKYRKRRAGIVKKAHDIATLCDIDVVLIMFSCTGRLDHFCSQPGRPISQDVIYSINNLARHHEMANRSGLDAPDRELRRSKENVDNVDCTLLQLQKTMMHPGRKAFNSEQEFRELVQGLRSVRLMIADGKEHSGNTSYNTSHGTQVSVLFLSNLSGVRTIVGQYMILMQQPQTRIEAGNWDLPGGGEHMQQQQRFPVFGEEPFSYLALMQHLQAPPPGHEICEGEEHIQQQEIPGLPMEDLFVSPEQLFGAQQDVGIFFSEQIESEPETSPYEVLDGAAQRLENTRNINGKRDRSD